MRSFVAQSHSYHVTALGDVDKDLRVVYGIYGTGDFEQTLHRAKCVARMQ
jgi:hypothetical protein